MTSRTPSTALVTPLPPYRSPPSRSSTASKAPVEAPLGTAARAIVPSSRAISTSTVGFPRESRISRAPTASMDATVCSCNESKIGGRDHPNGGPAPNRAGLASRAAPRVVRDEAQVRRYLRPASGHGLPGVLGGADGGG